MLLFNAKIYTSDAAMNGSSLESLTKNGCIENGFMFINDDGMITDIGDMADLGLFAMTSTEKDEVVKSKHVTRGNYDRSDVEKSAIKARIDIENREEKINMTGLSLYPGFIDAHCHIGAIGNGLTFEGDDVNECTDPCTPQLRAIDTINPNDFCFSEAILAGVTTVATGMGSANPIGGSMLIMRTYGEDIIDKRVINDQVGIKFALGENPKNVYNEKKRMPTTRMGTASIIREMLYKAKEYMENKEKGVQVAYDMKCEALIPLLKQKTAAHFHCHRADDIATAKRIATEFNLKYVIVHGTEGHLFEGLIDEDTPCIVGPIISDRSKPELRNQSICNAAKLTSYGIEVSICTDHPVVPIQYLPLSAGIAVRGGLSEKEALDAITINPAKLLGVADKIGSFAVGRYADIVAIKSEYKFYEVDAVPEFVMVKGALVCQKGS